jgi:hypothetical protein
VAAIYTKQAGATQEISYTKTEKGLHAISSKNDAQVLDIKNTI